MTFSMMDHPTECGYSSGFKLVRSTFDIEPRMWLFTQNPHTGKVKAGINLDRERAVELRDQLDIFIKENS